MSADDRAYADRLGDVLRQRSVGALRSFLEAEAGRYGDERQVEAIRAQSDAEIEVLLHRMTLVRADLTDLHAASQRWLAAQSGGSGPSGAGPSRARRGPNGQPRRPRPPQA